MHRLSDICVSFVDDEYDASSYLEQDNLEKIFLQVFEKINDSNGIPLIGRIKFNESYIQIIEKCTIENSMDLIYRLLNKHIDSQETVYFKDDEKSLPSLDVLKVLELLRHLHEIRIPKKFVCGFLLLLVKFIYFPIQPA